MKLRTRLFATMALTAVAALWLTGCGGDSTTTTAPPAAPPSGVQATPDTHEDHPGGSDAKPDTHQAHPAGKHEAPGHKEGEHKEAGHREGAHKEAAHKEGHAEKHGHAEGQEKGHGHAGHGSEADMKAVVARIASYADAMHEIGELRDEIEHRIESGKLADVHPPAQHISLIARRLPELAQKSDVPKEHWKDINSQSRELANLFDEIDEAADSGKRPETEAAFAKMVKLIDSLKAHVAHETRKREPNE